MSFVKCCSCVHIFVWECSWFTVNLIRWSEKVPDWGSIFALCEDDWRLPAVQLRGWCHPSAGMGPGGGGALLAAQLTEFQVRFNFHNKPGGLEQQECPAKLLRNRRGEGFDRLGFSCSTLKKSVRTDENTQLDFALEKMHWEQFLRLTNGKVSAAFCEWCGRFCDRGWPLK